MLRNGAHWYGRRWSRPSAHLTGCSVVVLIFIAAGTPLAEASQRPRSPPFTADPSRMSLGYDLPIAASGDMWADEGGFRFVHLRLVDPERNPWLRERKRMGHHFSRGWLGARIDCGWTMAELPVPEALDVSDGDAFFYLRPGPGTEDEVRGAAASPF